MGEGRGKGEGRMKIKCDKRGENMSKGGKFIGGGLLWRKLGNKCGDQGEMIDMGELGRTRANIGTVGEIMKEKTGSAEQ